MQALELVRDFVNTADLEAGEEKLVDARALQHWLAAHGLAEPHAHATRADLEQAVSLREALRELLRAHTGVAADPGHASSILDDAARRLDLRLRFVDGAVAFVPRSRGLGGVLAAVAETMADGSWARLKACRSDTCRWAFIDTARNHTRQWCDMKVCGNREKARRFRSRHA